MMKKISAIYAFCAFAVLLPLLGRGYILTLDMVFTPELRIPDTIGSSYLFHAGLHVLNFVVPSDILQKTMLFAILFLSGVGMHLLVRLVHDSKDWYGAVGAYVAGLFYMINPFTYDRLMAGQYAVLLGYALLPFFVRSLLIFLQKPSPRSILILSTWAVGISIVSIHTVGIAIVIGLIAGAAALWQHRRQKSYAASCIKYAALGCALFIATSSYWLVPLALGKGSTATEISRYGGGDSATFATIGESPAAKIGTIIRLQGFWVEGRDLYTLPQARTPIWGLLVAMLWGVVVTGIVSLWRARQRFLVAVFGASIVLGIVLASGVLNNALESLVPPFAGYREPQKFVALVALGYCVFAAAGAAAIMRHGEKQLESPLAAKAAAAMLLLLPIVITPTMLWGGNGQLRPRAYPADWYAVNASLNRDNETFRVLFLPWHLYMHFGFADRIIANPTPAFFDKPVIVSDNPEFKDASPAKSTPVKRRVGQLLESAPERSHNLGADLAALDIKYILLAKETDYRDYAYLDKQSDLVRVSETDSVVVYRNQAFREGH